jgi:hypothetical protein
MSFVAIDIVDDLEFEVIKEVWNVYKIPQDDATLKFKVVVTKILKTNKLDELSGLNAYVTGYQNILSVKSSIKGQPSQKIPQTRDELENYQKHEVEYEELRTDWNQYKVFNTDSTVLYEIKPIITNVYRINGVYDAIGYPYYVVTSQIISRVKKIE